MDSITKVLLAITTVALVATLVVNGKQTAQVIGAAGQAFSSSLKVASAG